MSFDPNTFHLISRNSLTEFKELPSDLPFPQHSNNSVDHPFQQAREYKRALNAAKLDRLFSKPFIKALEGNPDGVTCLSRAGAEISYIVSGGYDGEVRVWNVGVNNCIYKMQAHDTIVTGVVVTSTRQSEQLIITSSSDSTAKIWPLSVATEISGSPAQVTRPLMTYNNQIPLQCVDYRRYSDSFCTGGNEGVDLWEFERDQPTQHFNITEGALKCKFSPTETNIIGITNVNRSIGFVDIRMSTPVTFNYSERRNNDLSWNPQKPYFFSTCSDDFNAYTYDMRYMKTPYRIHSGHVGPVLTIDYAPSGIEFCTGSYDKTVKIFDPERVIEKQCYYGERMQKVYNVCYSADAHYIFSASDDGNIRVWKAKANESTKLLGRDEVRAINYREALVKKYENLSEINKIIQRKKLPKENVVLRKSYLSSLDSKARGHYNKKIKTYEGIDEVNKENKMKKLKLDINSQFISDQVKQKMNEKNEEISAFQLVRKKLRAQEEKAKKKELDSRKK
ncbi:protein SOF1, putative [Entamoeba invadens IP1]|uniref:DDB1- and CUL4-associated factor 13 n=1 Tax=Entamoeba invadens IP1 TaxID=370355 RepID=A0A0A1UBX6_ENTIV|nr:protein SOF1, putative [Entamoeba invadens IP1]ELP89804.1 protein SOF1, putative [Entamoeba invadens IP1]|eukprot:XP_004256575.1 protein SOF1, putative [Entamoeba invadens IP1]